MTAARSPDEAPPAMTVRMPSLDFSETPARWLRNGELAQVLNANALGIPHLERFLNKVMARARQMLPSDDPESERIRRDITLFIKQESCHHTVQDKFNRMLNERGYDLAPLEAEIAAHYDRLWRTRSMRFLTAYCEAFETLGPPAATAWIDGDLDPHLEGGDRNAAMMWKWHVMEEFEHRTVCHDVYHHLYGGYFLRIYAYFYQFRCMFSLSAKAARVLLEQDRASMTAAERRQSRKNARAATWIMMMPMLRGMLRTLMPGYSPRSLPVPRRFVALRKEIETRYLATDPASAAPEQAS